MILPSGPNKAIASEKPSIYMNRLKERHGLTFDSILSSNLIPPLEDSGLLLDDFEYFLAMRLEVVLDRIRQLVEGIDGSAVAAS